MTSKRIIDWIAFLAAVLAMPGGAAVAIMGLIDVRGITGACLALTGMMVICLSGTALHIIKVFESLPPKPSVPDPARCRWKECFAPECETHCPKAMAARFAEQKRHSRPRKRESEGKIRRRDDPPG